MIPKKIRYKGQIYEAVRLKESYSSVADKIYSFFKTTMKNSGISRYSYNDFYVYPDDFGGGMGIHLMWDGDVSEDTIIRQFRSKFNRGVEVSETWGRDWDHNIDVKVDEWLCQF